MLFFNSWSINQDAVGDYSREGRMLRSSYNENGSLLKDIEIVFFGRTSYFALFWKSPYSLINFPMPHCGLRKEYLELGLNDVCKRLQTRKD